jgi:hypothetical protein
MGTAAAFEEGGNDGKSVHDRVYAHGKALHRPEAHWTSRIGAGTAAALEPGHSRRPARRLSSSASVARSSSK